MKARLLCAVVWCLSGQVGWAVRSNERDEVIIDQALSKCLGANLSTGTNELFAEMKAGAAKEQAIERGAHARQQVEQEFLARVHALRDQDGKVAQH